jgi:hypothetical protein
MSIRYVDAPGRPPPMPLIIPPPPRKQFSPVIVWIIAAIIIIIVIVLVFLTSSKQQKTVLYIPDPDDTQNLETLVNLDPAGLCCRLPSSVTVTERYIYSPNTDRTYSSDQANVAAVCQGLTGQQLTDCQNEVAGSDGKLKVVAHKGIKPYYTFALGQAGSSICQNFQVCPNI